MKETRQKKNIFYDSTYITFRKYKLNYREREFPGGPVVRTLCFHSMLSPNEEPGSIPGWGTKVLQAMQCGQKNLKIKKKKVQ